MKILFVNASPKGERSVTLQTARYISKRYPNACEYSVLHAGARIKALEKDFTEAENAINAADAIIFVYPVYTFIAPYQLHRFIELTKDSEVSCKGKYCAQILTSKHFYDVTAMKYVEANALDLGMRYLGALSADMEDLQSEEGRYEAECFFERFLFDVAKGNYTEAPSHAPQAARPVYEPTLAEAKKSDGKDVVVVTNATPDDVNLRNMIEDFANACAYPVRVVNVRKFPFKGGCLGCFNCAISGKCVYNDGFEEFLRNDVQRADAIVYAFTISDHYTHSSFKLYDDRQFCNGHRTVTAGKVTGYIISGEYSKEANLRMIVEARANVSGMYFAGVAGNEGDTVKELAALAETVRFALDKGLRAPQNFYGVGGTKIFRDLVYTMQGIMQADHAFYKAHGVYDFPQKKRGMILAMKFLGLLMRSTAVQKKMKGQMTKYMLMPYEKVLAKTTPKDVALPE